MRQWIAGAAVAVVLAVCFAGYVEGAAPEPTGPPQGADRWRFELSPFIWISDIDGSMTVEGVKTDVEASFSDIVEALDFGLMGRVEAHKGKLGFFFEGMGMKLSEGVSATDIDVDMEVKLAIVEAGVSYRVLELPFGKDNRKVATCELMGGGRYTYGKVEIDISPGPDISASEDWIDPIVGARVRVPFTDRLGFTVRGDVGGFGIGDSSEFAWNLVTVLGYRLTERMSIEAGYRVYDFDYEGSRKNEFDLKMYGPLLGVTFYF